MELGFLDEIGAEGDECVAKTVNLLKSLPKDLRVRILDSDRYRVVEVEGVLVDSLDRVLKHLEGFDRYRVSTSTYYVAVSENVSTVVRIDGYSIRLLAIFRISE